MSFLLLDEVYLAYRTTRKQPKQIQVILFQNWIYRFVLIYFSSKIIKKLTKTD
jgi:ACR3 family arsenite efflux pump ArsB